MAITKPNLTRIWAADAAGSDVVDPDVQTPGKFALGWGAEKPPYQFFNFMQKLFTQGLGYFDEQGIAFWNTDTDYQNFSITKGSNGSLYFLKASGDGTEDPVDDGSVNWTPLPTRAEVDAKANQATTYTKTEANTLLATKTEKPSETAITASATFTNSTNNIALTGIGSIGLEIGDVVQVTGTADNNKLFTVEVITDSDNVIVNQAHAGGATTKSLVNETVSATVTLLSKWFNAPIGLGQGWADVFADRSESVLETNNTRRSISVNIASSASSASGGARMRLLVDGRQVSVNSSFAADGSSTDKATAQGVVPVDSVYITDSAIGPIQSWEELR